jgi:hypothetical protein
MNTAAAPSQEFALSPVLIGACLDDLTRVLADRPAVPEDQRCSHAAAVRSLILSFQPRDTLQLLLAGQAVLFAALTIDGSGDVLDGAAASPDPRARSSVTAMGRIVAKHIDTLIKLQGALPIWAEPPMEIPEQIPTVPVQPQDLDHVPSGEAETPAIEAQAVAAPARLARSYPAREAMLASRAGRLSNRKKTQLAHKLMNVLRTAQAP